MVTNWPSDLTLLQCSITLEKTTLTCILTIFTAPTQNFGLVSKMGNGFLQVQHPPGQTGMQVSDYTPANNNNLQNYMIKNVHLDCPFCHHSTCSQYWSLLKYFVSLYHNNNNNSRIYIAQN